MLRQFARKTFHPAAALWFVAIVDMTFSGDASHHQRPQNHEARPNAPDASHQRREPGMGAEKNVLIDNEKGLEG